MKQACAFLMLFVMLAAVVPCAGASDEDYSGSTMQYIYVTQSASMVKVGEEVRVNVEIIGRDTPYQIVYKLICDCPYQEDSFTIANVLTGQKIDEVIHWDYLERNAMTIFWMHVPTDVKQFFFIPKHRGHYFVSAIVIDANGLEYWADTTMILAYDDADRMNDHSEYNIAQRVIKETVKDHMTSREVAAAIHDWVVDNIDFGELPGYETALSSHLGVCSDYSVTYAFLCTLAGLKCQFFRSGKMGHAWNIVWIEGKWLHVDCTWDDPGNASGEKGSSHHHYLLMTSKEMAKDHQWDTYPDCMLSPYPY